MISAEDKRVEIKNSVIDLMWRCQLRNVIFWILFGIVVAGLITAGGIHPEFQPTAELYLIYGLLALPLWFFIISPLWSWYESRQLKRRFSNTDGATGTDRSTNSDR